MRRFGNMRGYFAVSMLDKNQGSPTAGVRFSVQAERAGNAAVLHCAGRLCFEGEAKLLAESALGCLRSADDVVLDLGAVAMVDSAGIGQLVLISMQAQALGRSVSIACAPDRVRKLLVLTNVASLFEFFETVDAALDACSEQVA
jgi:anti-sigma B factor antagonist